MEKNRVKINKVTVFGPPFNGESFEPTNVNFVFGKNGAGKSTISRAIRDAKDISWVNGSYDGTSVQVFNDEYIKNNIDGQMNGVFTISEPDIETEKDIEKTETDQKQNDKEIEKQNSIIEANATAKAKLESDTYDSCWATTRGLIKQLKNNPTNGRSKEAFFKEISAANPVEHAVEEIQKLENLAYDKNLRLLDPYVNYVLPSLDATILSTPIVSIGDTQFSLFMKEMGQEASDWIYRGFKKFQPVAGGLCPYCQEVLKPEKKLALEQAFDDSYSKAVERLNKLKEYDFPKYKSDVCSFLNLIENSDGFVFIEHDEYKELKREILGCLELMMRKIDEKESFLSSKIMPVDIESSFIKLGDLLEKANMKIEEQNKLFEAGDMKMNFRKAVVEQCAFMCESNINYYREKKKELQEIGDKANVEFANCKNMKHFYSEKLARLRAKTTSTLPVINKINNLLAASGFNSFSIAPVGKRNYKLVRPDNSDAQFLSEGEKNFICFLYFYYSVYGVLDETLGLDDRVVVIDDPVSSMDSDSVFIIAELVREIVDAVINAFNPVKIEGLSTHIKQVFVLTHNSFFYNEVAPMYIDSYANVSYFEIQKEGTKSHIVPNIKVINAGALNEKKVNYLPDLGNYSSLWEIYNTSDNPRILMNTMRRILEEYFLHNLGYRPMDFKKQILDHIKDGSMDSSDKILIRALVNYVANDAISSINFSTYTSDIKKLKDIFAVIFSCFHQDQHYNMMINR